MPARNLVSQGISAIRFPGCPPKTGHSPSEQAQASQVQNQGGTDGGDGAIDIPADQVDVVIGKDIVAEADAGGVRRDAARGAQPPVAAAEAVGDVRALLLRIDGGPADAVSVILEIPLRLFGRKAGDLPDSRQLIRGEGAGEEGVAKPGLQIACAPVVAFFRGEIEGPAVEPVSDVVSFDAFGNAFLVLSVWGFAPAPGAVPDDFGRSDGRSSSLAIPLLSERNFGEEAVCFWFFAEDEGLARFATVNFTPQVCTVVLTEDFTTDDGRDATAEVSLRFAYEKR